MQNFHIEAYSRLGLGHSKMSPGVEVNQGLRGGWEGQSKLGQRPIYTQVPNYGGVQEADLHPRVGQSIPGVNFIKTIWAAKPIFTPHETSKKLFRGLKA